MVARILIDSSVKGINKVFDYKVPKELENLACIGKRVLINFGNGRGRKDEGIIVKLQDKPSKEGMRLKNISEILDENPVVTSEKLSFAKWMSKQYFCNVYDCLKLMFPPGTTAKFKEKNIKIKYENKINLVEDVDFVKVQIRENKIKSAKHMQVLNFLIDSSGSAMQKDILEGIGITKGVLDTMQKHGLVSIEKVEIKEEYSKLFDIKENKEYSKKNLTSEQQTVFSSISSLIDRGEYANCILKAITGSGKTEVYINLIEKVIKEGKKAIMLVPEISLTYMMAERFVSRFGNEVAILHSKMTNTERKNEWRRIYNNEVKIVVGARSAIFSPINFEDLGIIIIDEEHDLSYTSQTTPRYITEEVAKFMCKKAGSVLLRGSATPSITTYYEAKEGDGILFTLNNRPGGARLPEIEILDMKQEYTYSHRRSYIYSEEFLDRLEENIARGEQTMIFLNRRGHSAYYICENCGEKLKCPNCDVAMTYHKKANLNICHYCSHVEKVTNVCPSCGKPTLKMHGVGVEKLEEELYRVCKDVKILRMDADTTAVKDGHKKILDAFKNNEANCLIGTQMISKGHDIANVTLVLVVSADSMLAINDYKAGEKAFSNMLQVAGRAGRKDKPGYVIIQTYDEKNNILEAVKEQDYDALYDEEIYFREMLDYPPFCDIIEIDLNADNLNVLQDAEKRFYMYLEKMKTEKMNIFSPKSPYIQKVNNKFRSYIIVKTNLDDEIAARIKFAIDKFMENERYKVTISVTKNPVFVG